MRPVGAARPSKGASSPRSAVGGRAHSGPRSCPVGLAAGVAELKPSPSRRTFDPTGRLNPGRTGRHGMTELRVVDHGPGVPVWRAASACPHCPTLPRDGLRSRLRPGGRIAAMRRRALGGGDPSTRTSPASWTLCVAVPGRARVVCPSFGGTFGHLMEGARRDASPRAPTISRVGGDLPTGAPGATTVFCWRARRCWPPRNGARVVPRRFNLPALPLRRRPLRPTGTGRVALHRLRDGRPGSGRSTRPSSTSSPPRAAGRGPCPGGGVTAAAPSTSMPGLRAEARGALARAGHGLDARRGADPGRLGRLRRRPSKDYGRLLDNPGRKIASRARVARTSTNGSPLTWTGCPAGPAPSPTPWAVQDPCHLRHVQQGRTSMSAPSSPPTRSWPSWDDEGLCLRAPAAPTPQIHPDMAGQLRDRKLDAIQAHRGDGPWAQRQPRLHHPAPRKPNSPCVIPLEFGGRKRSPMAGEFRRDPPASRGHRRRARRPPPSSGCAESIDAGGHRAAGGRRSA